MRFNKKNITAIAAAVGISAMSSVAIAADTIKVGTFLAVTGGRILPRRS